MRVPAIPPNLTGIPGGKPWVPLCPLPAGPRDPAGPSDRALLGGVGEFPRLTLLPCEEFSIFSSHKERSNEVGFCIFNLKSWASNMEMQITEASPAVRSSLRLLLNSFVALGGKKKTVFCANLDAHNLSVLGKDVPNFKGCEKKEVWSYAQLCLWKRWLAHLASCPVSEYLEHLYSQPPWIMKAKRTHQFFQPLAHSSLSPYLVLHPSFQSSVPFYYYLCTVLSALWLPLPRYKDFTIKLYGLVPSLGSLPADPPALVVMCVHLFPQPFQLASSLALHMPYTLLPPAGAFSPPSPVHTWPSVAAKSLLAEASLVACRLWGVCSYWKAYSTFSGAYGLNFKCLLKCHLLEHSALTALSKIASFSPLLSPSLFFSTACLFYACL